MGFSFFILFMIATFSTIDLARSEENYSDEELHCFFTFVEEQINKKYPFAVGIKEAGFYYVGNNFVKATNTFRNLAERDYCVIPPENQGKCIVNRRAKNGYYSVCVQSHTVETSEYCIYKEQLSQGYHFLTWELINKVLETLKAAGLCS